MSVILSRIVPGFALVWLVLGAWLTSDGGTSIDDLLELMAATLGLGIAWLVAVVVAARKTPSTIQRLKFTLIAIPILVVMGIGVHWFEAALPLRFAASRSSLERYAKSASASALKTTKATRVGLFTVQETEALDNEVVRLITAKCMVDDCGFVYSPNGAPPPLGEDSYIHLTDAWFYWERSW